MMATPRTAVFIFASLCGLAACAEDTRPSDALERHRRDAGTVDTATSTSDAASGGTPSGGTVSCYTEGAPDNTCALPVHCCFSNYSAQHNGRCTTDRCAWGTIDCDGPEDCAAGQHCCSTEQFDADGIAGYRVACQASACDAPPSGEELCHPGGPACANGGSCITTYGTNNDLPRTLYICR